MIELIISAIYFIFPAYIANMMPVILGKMKFPLGIPIHKKVFGAHKTWRGFYSGYIGALIILFLQQYFQNQGILESVRMIDYSSINIFLYSFLFGVGAITGDLIKSFFKRKCNRKSGSPWFPFDQIDFIVGAFIFVFLFYPVDWKVIFVVVLITPLLHFLTNVVGYWCGFKKVWW